MLRRTKITKGVKPDGEVLVMLSFVACTANLQAFVCAQDHKCSEREMREAPVPEHPAVLRRKRCEGIYVCRKACTLQSTRHRWRYGLVVRISRSHRGGPVSITGIVTLPAVRGHCCFAGRSSMQTMLHRINHAACHG